MRVQVVGDREAAENGFYYVHSDHLGSVHILTRLSDGYVEAGSLARYAPFGDWRTEPTTNPTLSGRGFTGHRHNNTGANDLGLIYMGARFYVPSIGRFASADTIVPDREDPQSFNRYAYARNNPVKYVDPDGHCWGFASGVRNWNFTIGGTTYGGGTNCANIDMALTIVQHPDATPGQKAQAGAYLGGWGVAAASGTAGTGLLACSTVAACAAAAEAALGIGTAACRDGNCTNEAEMAARSAQSVWKMNPFQRGMEIENMLGRSPHLAQNFPVIDKFENGVATSIKSLDLGAKSYQNIGTLTRTVQGYVNTLANWRGVSSWGGVTIRNSDIAARQLQLAIPQGASQAQIDALLRLQQWTAAQGVTLNVVVVP